MGEGRRHNCAVMPYFSSTRTAVVKTQTVGADAHIGPLGIDANRTPIDRTQACEPVGADCIVKCNMVYTWV